MAFIGGAIVIGGTAYALLDVVMSFVGLIWPLALIGVGLYILWRQWANGRREDDGASPPRRGDHAEGIG